MVPVHAGIVCPPLHTAGPKKAVQESGRQLLGYGSTATKIHEQGLFSLKRRKLKGNMRILLGKWHGKGDQGARSHHFSRVRGTELNA